MIDDYLLVNFGAIGARTNQAIGVKIYFVKNYFIRWLSHLQYISEEEGSHQAKKKYVNYILLTKTEEW